MKSLILPTLLFLISWTICSASDFACPPPDLITPCKCRRIFCNTYPVTVTCSNITKVQTLHDLFEKSLDWTFDAFILEYSTVMHIPAYGVVSKRIKEITIRKSILIDLFDVPPKESNAVTHINIFDSDLRVHDHQWQSMSTLSNLKSIHCQNSEFSKLDKTLAENIGPSLKWFTMKNTKTVTLDDNVFVNMTHLDRIKLTFNEISILKRSMFANPSNFFLFDFRNNRIETLPDDIFHGMDKLEEIYLQGNRIKHFTESVFGGQLFNNVILHIQLEENPMACDCSMRWFFYREKRVNVVAKCSEPSDRANKYVRELTKSDFNYCLTRSNAVWDTIE